MAKTKDTRPTSSVRKATPYTKLFEVGVAKFGLYRYTVNDIEAGLGVSKVRELSKFIGVSEAQVRRLSRISSSSFARRVKSGKLSPEESDRLARLSRVTAAAVEFFEGDREDAYRWLHAPAPALDGKKPIEIMINDAGVKTVEDLLIRLEYGVFT